MVIKIIILAQEIIKKYFALGAFAYIYNVSLKTIMYNIY